MVELDPFFFDQFRPKIKYLIWDQICLYSSHGRCGRRRLPDDGLGDPVQLLGVGVVRAAGGGGGVPGRGGQLADGPRAAVGALGQEDLQTGPDARGLLVDEGGPVREPGPDPVLQPG